MKYFYLIYGYCFVAMPTEIQCTVFTSYAPSESKYRTIFPVKKNTPISYVKHMVAQDIGCTPDDIVIKKHLNFDPEKFFP